MNICRISGMFPVVRMREEMDRVFAGLAETFPEVGPLNVLSGRAVPALNVWEDDTHLYAEAEVPGLKLDDLEITLVGNELTRAGFMEHLNAGLVLTGGGSLIEGLAELAEQRFGLPVRLGQPTGVEGLVDVVSSPTYSTAVGLVLYGHYNRDVDTYFGRAGAGLLGRTAGRLSRWLTELF